MSTLTSLKRLLTAVVLACAIPMPVANAAILSLQPDTTFATTGDSVSLDLIVSGLGDFSPDSLGVFNVSVGFDASALSFTGYSLGSFLGDLGLAEALDISAGDSGGAVNVGEVSLLDALDLDVLQPGAFILASLSFDVIDLAIGAGTKLSVLRGVVLGDAGGIALPVTVADSAAIIGRSSVPVTGTLFLMISSLFSWRIARQLRGQRS